MPMNPFALSTRDAINAAKLCPESDAIAEIRKCHHLSDTDRERILWQARSLLGDMRARAGTGDLTRKLFQEIDLSAPEGRALMSLAEALLRVPDAETAEALVQEKLEQGNWQRFRATVRSPELKTMGVLLGIAASMTGDDSLLQRSTGGATLPTIRAAAKQMILFMAKRFVFASTIEEAIAASSLPDADERYSFDMLGEGARTMKQGGAFRESYANAISTLGQAILSNTRLAASSISVKLSALHPRFEAHQGDRLRSELLPLVEDLAHGAKCAGIDFTIDAEEADRLEPMLDIFEALTRSPRLAGWDGLGFVVQAYGKRATSLVAWLDELGRATRRRIPLRLVKGAYWDSEIKHAQAQGFQEYPVFTRKEATDVSYLACASLMFDRDRILPQFATHNVETVCAIRHVAGSRPFEFQRLHGMGVDLYAAARAKGMTTPVRVYAPIGEFKELLPYLIRRLLENTASSSFVHSAFDPTQHVDEVIKDPVALLDASGPRVIPLPRDIFSGRKNSIGVDFTDVKAISRLSRKVRERAEAPFAERSAVNMQLVRSPADRRKILGAVRHATGDDVEGAVTEAERAFASWQRVPARDRAAILERAADVLERQSNAFVALIVSEAGRTLRDALSEIREAVDFLRYYAAEARRSFGETVLAAVTGERNTMRLKGRGVFACVSPWNFPLAIFMGQVSAALAAGNTVVAKPAEQTPLTAAAAVGLLHQAGVPENVLHLVQGGAEVGRLLVSRPEIGGVAFTGSTAAAKAIQRQLANENVVIVPLIAETGGINAMIVDGSALPEHVVDDVVTSGFLSAGQRCSSLRHLFIHEECADQLVELITGAMETLRVGDPSDPATDVGPLIDEAACDAVARHIESLVVKGARIAGVAKLGAECEFGSYIAPMLLQLPEPDLLTSEVFAPVVHVSRWSHDRLDAALRHLAGTGFGLTLGVHSRIVGFADRVISEMRCGNSYINRNMVGAVVGAQPFGGRGLSGTGPKAGGPNYLARFAVEEVVTENLTAIGGNVELLSA